MAVVEIESRGATRVLWLNRPERRNALSGDLIVGLAEALAAAGADHDVRCVVLTGRDRFFCAGGDLAGGMMPEGGVLEAEAARGRFAELLRAIYGLPVPVIAAVNGDALGGGCGLVAACDLAVADPAASLGTPEVRVGLFPLVISAVLQRGVQRKALLEMMYTGDRISAAEAERIGLINRVSPAGGCLEAALELAERITRNSRAVVGLGKRSFHDAIDMELAGALAMLNSRLTLNLLSEDAGIGIAAFLGRTAPEWRHR